MYLKNLLLFRISRAVRAFWYAGLGIYLAIVGDYQISGRKGSAEYGAQKLSTYVCVVGWFRMQRPGTVKKTMAPLVKTSTGCHCLT